MTINHHQGTKMHHLSQPAILSNSSPFGHSLFFSMRPDADLGGTLKRIAEKYNPEFGVLGIGEPFTQAISHRIPGLRTFPSMSGPGFSIPSTQKALWIFLRGRTRTEVFDRYRSVHALLAQDFLMDDAMETFSYADGRDLSGYEDGTENPSPELSPGVALVQNGKGMAGSSFAGVQRWIHDLDRFQTHSEKERDNIIGRRRDTNEEILEAPPSAHVKRSAQESFTPPAHLLRRSMPWARKDEQGLEFVAFANSLSPFEIILRRMAGQEDGIADALFSFTLPITGGYYWCPPIRNGLLDFTLMTE